MAVVHQNFVDLAARLIKKNGRVISIKRQVGTALKDPAKPWLGEEPDFRTTRTPAVFLDNDSRDLLLMLPGEADQRTTLEREIDRVVLIAAKGLSFDIKTEHQIVDGNKTWEITNVVEVKPGPTTIFWKLRVSN